MVHWTALAARLHTGGLLSRGSIRFGKMTSLPTPLNAHNVEAESATTCFSFSPVMQGQPRVEWRTAHCNGGSHPDESCPTSSLPRVQGARCPDTGPDGAYLGHLPRVWVFCERSLAGSNKKRSPGIVGFVPGATVFVRIPLPHGDRASRSRLRISLSYLVSHEHMARALLRCRLPCTCETQTIDAHRTSNERNSAVYQMHAFELAAPANVTGSASECELEVRVLPQTSSGEHKFKLQQLTVTPLMVRT